MKSAKDYLKAEVERKLAEARSITKAAEDENRNPSDEERKSVESLLSEVTGLKTRIQELEDNEKLQETIKSLGEGPDSPVSSRSNAKDATSLGDAFVKSDAFRALKERGTTGRWSTGAVELDGDFAKATFTTGSYPSQPDFQGTPNPVLFRKLTVADLLASGTTDSAVIRYVMETTATNAAAGVAEGGLKPESTIAMTPTDEPIRKIATFLPITDEMLEDEAQLRAYLDARLRLFVQLEEERQLLSGSGSGADIRGLLNRTGIQTTARASSESIADAIYRAITNVRNNAELEPDGIIMHPTNWAAVRTAKDANGQYYGGGPFTGAYGQAGGMAPNNLWDLPVAVTSAVPLDTAVVGAFKATAQVFRKGGLTVEASNSHADFFQRNMTAVRAEERVGLAVYRPAGIHTVTALTPVV